MFIYIVQCYDSSISCFDPYYIIFDDEDRAKKHVELCNSSSDSERYGYVKKWLNVGDEYDVLFEE